MLARDGEPVAALTHDPSLSADPGLVSAVAAAAGLALENERLHAQVQAHLVETRASRTRLVAAADAERQRVERNLHDGAQQRMLNLMLALRTAQTDLSRGAYQGAGDALEAATGELGTPSRSCATWPAASTLRSSPTPASGLRSAHWPSAPAFPCASATT